MKILYARVTTEGEQINVEIAHNDHKKLEEELEAVYRLTDARIAEMNNRYLDACKVADIFPPEYRASFKQAIDILYSRQLDRLQLIARLRDGAVKIAEKAAEVPSEDGKSKVVSLADHKLNAAKGEPTL